jgi:hypothetical protein
VRGRCVDSRSSRGTGRREAVEMGISVCGEGFKAGGGRRVFWFGDRCIPCCLGKTTAGNRCLSGLKGMLKK